MKNSFIWKISKTTLIVFLLLCFNSCVSKEKNNIDNVVVNENKRIILKDYQVIKGDAYIIVEVDGHEYLSTGDGIIHIESCTCKKK